MSAITNIDFGFFFFNSEDEKISGNYALHAKKAVSTRVAEREPRVRNSGWQVLSGDLFGPRNIQIMLTAAQGNPNATLLGADLRRSFLNGSMPGFVPYLIGMFMCPVDALRHADSRLKEDKIAGYRGLATFTLPDQNAIMEIGTALALPMTSLHTV